MIASATTTLTGVLQSGAKNIRSVLPLIRETRFSAGALMRDLFPEDLKKFELPQLSATTLSKGRLSYVCNPFFRTGLCFIALRVGGAPKERAQLAIDWAQELVDRLWEEEGRDVEISILIRAGAELSSEEKVAETEFLLDVSGGRTRWLSFLKKRRAHDYVLIQRLSRGDSPKLLRAGLS